MQVHLLAVFWKTIYFFFTIDRESILLSSFTLSSILGVTVLEGPIYAVGGHDGWSYLNTVERWDPQSQQWTFVASMSIARSTVGVAALNGKWVGYSYMVETHFLGESKTVTHGSK